MNIVKMMQIISGIKDNHRFSLQKVARIRRHLEKLVERKPFDYWTPLVVNTNAPSWGSPGRTYDLIGSDSYGDSFFTDKKPCEDTSTDDYLKSLPGAFREDYLGQVHDCERGEDGNPSKHGEFEDFSGQPDPDSRYGPHLCDKCHDTSECCMRVRCNACGYISRRFMWGQRVMMTMKIDNPRSIVLWTVE